MTKDKQDKLKRGLAGKSKGNLARRFYKTASVGGDEAPFAVLLDGRGIKTPAKADLALPACALAEAVAAEWQTQGDSIDPASMPLTRLCNTAIDRVSSNPSPIIAEIMAFAGSDLLCYRADGPDGLVLRQEALWDPLLAHMGTSYGARFKTVTGVLHQAQPEPTLQAMGDYLATREAFELTAIHNLTTVTGSCVIAVALSDGFVTGNEAWSAAQVDEDWQIEHWGEDDEARIRRAANRCEFDTALRLLDLLQR